jgi:hypothetical protein
MDKMKTLLFEKPYWGLKRPKLIISVTGGANLKATKLVQQVFCKGLIKVASSTGKQELF